MTLALLEKFNCNMESFSLIFLLEVCVSNLGLWRNITWSVGGLLLNKSSVTWWLVVQSQVWRHLFAFSMHLDPAVSKTIFIYQRTTTVLIQCKLYFLLSYKAHWRDMRSIGEHADEHSVSPAGHIHHLQCRCVQGGFGEEDITGQFGVVILA